MSTVQAAEFEVGAGFEFVGAAAPGYAGAAIGQAEVDGRLRVGPLGFRADLDLVGPGPYPGITRAEPAGLTLFPEWAAAIMGTETGWMIATGFQPHPFHTERVDGWNNAFVPYTYGFAELWPGHFLGIRGQTAFADGYLVTSLWGGANSGRGDKASNFALGAPVLGANLVLGRVDALDARAAVTLLPTERQGVASASVRVPIPKALDLTSDLYLGFGGGLRASWNLGVELFPDYWVSPVARGEWTSGLGPPWIVDAGVAMQPFESLRVVFTGRMDGGEPQGFLGVSLFDDVTPGPGWDFR
ncbi:MAG: hypothetical protein H6741_14105 [Alphaproteobacteria bacterium]|nr:hypothetical protein [Alphaproteobacteria bacterium]MCB9793848.1 hypothetical protein [Alphaproteobacteria bacterium]